MHTKTTITPVADRQLSDALSLVWRVFLEFEAPVCSDEGVAEFRRFIEPDAIEKRLRDGELAMWVYREAGAIRGVIALRPPCHICLLFVDSRYHRRGIARALFEHMCAHTRENTPHAEMTVNSSPYAAGFYRRMGFSDTDSEQTVNGIRFMPMKTGLYS